MSNIVRFPGKAAPQSLVISVKQGKGCYRHLRMPSASTLEDLSNAILWAFEFDDDHGHAFYLDNCFWSDAACYMDNRMDEDDEYPHTCDASIALLSVGQKFKYLFDFGDNWEFDCQVLRTMEDCDEIELVRVHGQAPEQYPDWDEDDEADNDDDPKD